MSLTETALSRCEIHLNRGTEAAMKSGQTIKKRDFKPSELLDLCRSGCSPSQKLGPWAGGGGGAVGRLFPIKSHAHIKIRRDHHVLMTGKSKLGVMSKHRLVVKNQSPRKCPDSLLDNWSISALKARTTATRDMIQMATIKLRFQ